MAAAQDKLVSESLPKESTEKSDRLEREDEVQARAEIVFGGKHEKCDVGIADIVTDTMLIEIKNYAHWTDGIGQLLKYEQYFPGRKKVLYLFGQIPKNFDLAYMMTTCKSAGIKYYRDELDYPTLYAESKDGQKDPYFHIPEPDEMVRVSDAEFREMHNEMIYNVAMAGKMMRDIKFIDCTDGMRHQIQLYQNCSKTLKELQDYLRKTNEDKHIAILFLEETIVQEVGAMLPTLDLNSALKSWLHSRGIMKFEQYREQVSLMLKERGATFIRPRSGTGWVGFRLKASK